MYTDMNEHRRKREKEQITKQDHRRRGQRERLEECTWRGLRRGFRGRCTERILLHGWELPSVGYPNYWIHFPSPFSFFFPMFENLVLLL